MCKKAPGNSFREGISLIEIMRMFPDDAAAEKWFVKTRWPDGVHCSRCGSANIQERKTRKPQPYRCRDCRKDFSVKTGTLMHDSRLELQVWAVAIYLLVTNLKGVSSRKLHRDLSITQKTAWHLAHRIRETWKDNQGDFLEPVEVDETFVGFHLAQHLPSWSFDRPVQRSCVQSALACYERSGQQSLSRYSHGTC